MSETPTSLANHYTTGVFESFGEKKRRVIDIRPDWYETHISLGRVRRVNVKVYEHRS